MSNIYEHSNIDVGVPPRRDGEGVTVAFHNFLHLPNKKGSHVKSSKFTCYNHVWTVRMFPRGTKEADGGRISVAVKKESSGSLSADLVFRVLDCRFHVISSRSIKTTPFIQGTSSGIHSLVHRSLVTSGVPRLPGRDGWQPVLDGGTLRINILMSLPQVSMRHWVMPTNPIAGRVHSLLLDEEESADVCFDVKSKDESRAQTFHAHRLILKVCAPDLALLCVDSGVKTRSRASISPSPTQVSIEAEPDAFSLFLDYVYGKETTSFDWETHAGSVLELANKYNVPTLKVEAEVRYVEHFKFTVNNVIEQILYADAMECPLLREASMNFILSPDNFKGVVSCKAFREDLLQAKHIAQEIVVAHASVADSAAESNAKVDFEDMPVDDIRFLLKERGLSLDGSLEMLISRLKISHSR
mmetsp:Transcript_23987/g.56801  ORF Transcript_23987/g.56801 Transcript_23987/m.56801 type:complete len:413 (-) Transcript_23987:63-1301(-)